MNAIGTLVSFILLWVLIYFLAIMPRRRKMKQHRQMIADLRLNDEVLTSGGIRGRVVRRTDALITVEVAPNVTFDLAPDKIESVVEREVRASQRTCARCGAPLDPTDRFCRKCSATAGGAGLPPPPLLRGRPAESRLPATQSRGPSAAPSPLP